MANPQLEDGFMRVANGIVDNICKLSLNGTEQKVIWCVIRYTYGFNRRSHCLSASFISQWANCDISSVKRALRHLQKMNIIVCINADKRGVTAELKFNKNYDQWKLTGGRNDTKGAVIPPRSEFLAVLGDQKQGNNIETPEALLRKIVREETAGRQTGGGSYRFTAQINRRTLFDEMMKEAQMRRDTSGRNPFEMA